VQNCSNLRDRADPYELPDLWPSNSPDFSPVSYKSVAQFSNKSTRQKRKM